MIDVLQDLNQKQKESVTHHTGSLLVKAGPGTGKTTVITRRIAYLIREHSVNPQNILAITFTDKASQVMRDRLSDEGLIEEYKSTQVKVFTFHAFCQTVLREHAQKIGLDKNFMVCNDEIREEILTECLHELKLINLNTVSRRLQWLSHDISYFKARIHDPLAPTSLLSSLKVSRAKYPEYVSNCENVFNTYQRKLEEQNLIDFDDLLLRTVELFENRPGVREIYQTEIHYVLVDEYQDVNSTQDRILQLLCATPKRNLMVVADEDQAIYGWRGADPRYIKKFEMDFNPKVVELDEDYRCTETILQAAQRVIAKDASITKRVLPKTTPNAETAPVIWHYSNQNTSKESDLISQLIRQLKEKRGYSYKEIAILYRNHKLADHLAVKLLEEGIQFQRVQPTTSLQNRDRQGIISHLRLLLEKSPDNSSDVTITPDDLEVAINFPQKCINDLTWVRLKWLAQREGIELIDLLKNIEVYSKDVGPLTRRNVHQFWKQIEQLSIEIQGKGINPIVQTLLAALESSQCPYKREEIDVLENQLEVPYLPTATDILYKAINCNERIQITVSGGIDEYCAAQIIRQTLSTYLKQDISIQSMSSNINEPVLDTNSSHILIGTFEELNINAVEAKTILIGTQSAKQTNLVQLDTNDIQSITALKLCQSLIERFESLSMPDLVVYDLETRGTNVGTVEIVEIAAQRINSKGDEIRKYHQLVTPPQGTLPRSSRHVHGITEETVENSPSIAEVLPSFLEFIQDCILIGHNITEFDNLVLERNLGEYCGGVELTDLCYDTLVVTRRLYPRKSSSLETLAERFDIEHGPLHRGEEDVEVTKKVFGELVKKDFQRCRIISLTEFLPLVGCAILEKTEGLSNNDISTETRVFLNAAIRFLQTHDPQGEFNLVDLMSFKPREKEKIETFIDKLRNCEVPDGPEDTNWKIHCTEFRNAVNDFKKESKTELITDFLAYQKQMKSIDDIEENDDQLTLMTLHTSKGTEYPIVIIIGMKEDTSQMGEEERRLFYVGMTRAEKGLYFTSIADPDSGSCSPLLFSEIPADFINRWCE